MRPNMLPPGLMSNLQQALSKKSGAADSGEPTVGSGEPEGGLSDDRPIVLVTNGDGIESPGLTHLAEALVRDGLCNVHVCAPQSPIVLVTNGDGIELPGLTHLVEALVRDGLCNVHVCAPQSDKSVSGHSITFRETVAVTSADISGATAYEVSGTPVDCVSIALSGALFPWSKPLLVISGINQGSSCGHNMFYSGAAAGAREALICGVPSLSISLNWKKNESQESDFKDAATVCLPLIKAAIRDIEKGTFPENCFLSVEIPSSPLTNKGFKVSKHSTWRSTPSWSAVSANRHAGHYMSNQQSLGIQLAQISRDASAAGAARRIIKQKPNVEVESVGASGKSDSNKVKKYFRLELEKQREEAGDEDLDFKALENGFIAVTPVSLGSDDVQTVVSEWVSAALQ